MDICRRYRPNELCGTDWGAGVSCLFVDLAPMGERNGATRTETVEDSGEDVFLR
jgi:hypothetical protein